MFDFEITIENVVMTGTLSESLDLAAANQKLEGSKHNWKRFPGLAYQLKMPRASFLLFRNGKFVCTGTKTQTKAKEATTNLLNILKTNGLISDNCIFECEVKNLVASVNLSGASIALEQFTTEFESVYEPDKFPAAVHKTDDKKATFLVFLSGKLICSGIADEQDLKQTVKKFYDQLKEKSVIENLLTPNPE